MFNHLIAETNGTRALYIPTNADGSVDESVDGEISVPVIAWDGDGYPLVAHEDIGNLMRAADNIVFSSDRRPSTFTGLDARHVATGELR